VNIGPQCCISQGAVLITGSHDYKKSSFDLRLGEIRLEQGVWIGAGAMVGPGVTCHSHSVLALNSVATEDLDPYMIYQGNPAVNKRSRPLKK
jgi:putative colanic acid biosynthesis acetyltransferase WcaF